MTKGQFNILAFCFISFPSPLCLPLIFSRDIERNWLQPGLNEAEIQELMIPFPEEEMQAHTISKLITSRTENSNVPDITKDVSYPELVS